MARLGETLFLFLIFGFSDVNSLNVLDSAERFKSLPETSSKLCTEIHPRSLSSVEKNYLIWFHESLRENVSKRVSEQLPEAFFMKKISWSNTLAKMAKKQALECKDIKNEDSDESIGQHVVKGVGNSGKVQLKGLLEIWAAGLTQLTPAIIEKYREPEPEDYDYQPLTQILWWNTEHFGCGRSVYKENCPSGDCTEEKTIIKLVCTYYPKGNKAGEPVYLSSKNKGLICKYDAGNAYCTSQEFNRTKGQEVLVRYRGPQRKGESREVEYRVRSRMIDLWPAAGSQANAWQAFDFTFFHLCLTLANLPYLNIICVKLRSLTFYPEAKPLCHYNKFREFFCLPKPDLEWLNIPGTFLIRYKSGES